MTPEQFVNMVLNAPNPQDSVRAVMLLRKQAAQESRAERAGIVTTFRCRKR